MSDSQGKVATLIRSGGLLFCYSSFALPSRYSLQKYNYTVSPKSKPLDVCLQLWQMWADFQNSFTFQLIRKKLLYVYVPQRFSPHLQYVAMLPSEIRNSKNVTDWFWQHPQQPVEMFLRTLWAVDLTFNSCQTDSKNADNLKFVRWRLESTVKPLFSWTSLHHYFSPDYLCTVFVLGYTSYIVHIFK